MYTIKIVFLFVAISSVWCMPNHFRLGELSEISYRIHAESVSFQQDQSNPRLFAYNHTSDRHINFVQAWDVNINGGRVVYHNDGIGTNTIFLLFDGPGAIEFLIDIYSNN
jgi:hypothetical protein